MDFLDIFNDENTEGKTPIKKEIVSDIDRKRRLDQILQSYIDKAEDFVPKKARLANESFQNPIDDISYKVLLTKNCVHEVVHLNSVPYTELKPCSENPVKKFDFTLDVFQQQAVQCIENNQSVLVSAHTSAGKTVCAIYAIALCMKEKRRVIYTTPIKALSNEKYRDFKAEFDDVGLMTGDVTINANASVLIMTTEILRLMLFRNSSVIREVGWIIYDEIHYMRDKSRGVVWEESIILLPRTLRILFLSATIPNARQFAQWITHLHRTPCNVIYTDYRPTPLQHYIYPNGADRMYQVVNKQGEFIDACFNESMASLRQLGDNAKSDTAKKTGRKGGSTSAESHCESVIKTVFDLKQDPVIVFSFSKKACEVYAKMLSKMDYTTNDQKKVIEEIFGNARNMLPEEDRQMTQLDAMLNLVKRGIGIHHGGLLPVLKEIVEILFGEGLIKCLFATETFAMGLNMPAKTVVFTAAHKFDGANIRLLSSGEYIQMSGRAGRRGRDTHGNVILMLDRAIKSEDAKQVIKGETEPLNSSFHLTYNMILNLMRSGDIEPEYLMKHSFLQFQTYSELPNLIQKFEEKEKELLAIEMSADESVSIRTYYKVAELIRSTTAEMWAVIRNENMYRSFIVPGRPVHIKYNDNDFGWCIIVSTVQTGKFKRQYIECLVPVSHESIFAKELSMCTPPPPPSSPTKESTPDGLLLSIELKYFLELSSVVIKNVEELLPSLRINDVARRDFLNKRNNIVAKFKTVPLLDPKKEIKCKPHLVAEFEQKLKKAEAELKRHSLFDNPEAAARITVYHRQKELELMVEQLRNEIDKKTSLIKMKELKSRKRILRQLNYCTDKDTIEIKGRVACEISTSDELMLTEHMLAGDFTPMSPPQLAAFLSCFVFEEMVKETIEPQRDLEAILEKMRENARRISRVSKDCRLTVLPVTDEDVYADSFKMGLVEIVRAWAMGSKFSVLCDNTAIYEGSIIRCIRRLDELLGQLLEASRVMGNIELETKFSAASNLIKKGIIFASSLYVGN